MRNLLFAVLIGSLSLIAATPADAEPFLQKTNLFESWTDGYGLFRIPGIVVTAKGTILAYCEARRGGSDWAAMDILLRRSTDQGRSWETARRIAEVSGPKPKNPVRHSANTDEFTYNNPIAIADRDGTVHLLFCLEYFRCFHQLSRDDGRTWSTPVEITSVFEAFRPKFDWRTLATGPGHGIQLRNGRLLAPIWISLGRGNNNHSPSLNGTIYSDDHGKTWRTGDLALTERNGARGASETGLLQLADGRVMLSARANAMGLRNNRLFSISEDGITRWSTARVANEISGIGCMAGFVACPPEPPAGRTRLLFSLPNPEDGSHDRKNLTVWMSEDDGATWPIRRTLEPGPSAYSDLAVLPDGTVLCFYESANPERKPASPYGFLTVARFAASWVTGE